MSVAFLGDSLTYGWLAEGAATWNERYAPRGAQNFGVPGELTDEVLYRIRAGDLDAVQPHTIVFLAGTNDLGSGRSAEDTVRGIEACVRALFERFASVRVLLLGLLPRGDGGAYGYAQVAAVNERLQRLDRPPRVCYFDCTPAFVDASGAVRAKLYDADLLHLAPAGYAAWADILARAPLRNGDVSVV